MIPCRDSQPSSGVLLGAALLALVVGLTLNLVGLQTRKAEATASVEALMAARKLRHGEAPRRLPALPGAVELELEALQGSELEFGRALDRYETEALIRLLDAWSGRARLGTLALGSLALGILLLLVDLVRWIWFQAVEPTAPPERTESLESSGFSGGGGDEDLEALVGALPLAVLLLDPQGRVDFANPAAEELLGIPCHRLLGQEVPLLHSAGDLEGDPGDPRRLGGSGWHPPGRPERGLRVRSLELEHRGRVALLVQPEEPGRVPDAEGPARSTPPGLGELTLRETEIFEMIVQGLSNREIAERLVISEGTVKSHVNRLLRKLDLRNRVQVLLYAASHDLLSDREVPV